ncbi:MULTISPECIES: ATP/GTP-binding protein [unclassified Brevundimonas]|uniref:AAA family ATPase n=1 Tax=unclassified Brevundimonas TaxID=2622653 RepID=UPI0025B85710|nr:MULTISPECIES: ATP/GTP-binding protein [unclassified Brevundimonas]
MLLRFTVENFLAFRDEAELNLLASRDDRHASHVTITSGLKQHRVVKAAAIYGANGHGKTKLIEAMSFVRDLLRHGTTGEDPIAVMPFRPEPEASARPAKFTFDINVDGVDYEYGIVVASDRVCEEWLFTTRKGKSIPMFERATTKATSGEYITEVQVGQGFRKSAEEGRKKGFVDFVAFGTRPTQPFLTESIERNIKEFAPIHNWFSHQLVILSADATYASLPIRAKDDQKFIQFVSDFMRRADIGIDHFEAEEKPFELSKLDIPEEFHREIQQQCEKGGIVLLGNSDQSSIAVKLDDHGRFVRVGLTSVHKAANGRLTNFAFDEESAGTQRLMHLLPLLLDIRTQDKTYIVDELDRKLHPLLAYRFLDAALSEDTIGQLVFTTHNIQLLDRELLRRDEIWFVEKDRDGASHLISLANIKVRPDLRISKGYWAGRFGGVPVDGRFAEAAIPDTYAEADNHAH